MELLSSYIQESHNNGLSVYHFVICNKLVDLNKPVVWKHLKCQIRKINKRSVFNMLGAWMKNVSKYVYLPIIRHIRKNLRKVKEYEIDKLWNRKDAKLNVTQGMHKRKEN